jgi:hypothetical protein
LANLQEEVLRLREEAMVEAEILASKRSLKTNFILFIGFGTLTAALVVISQTNFCYQTVKIYNCNFLVVYVEWHILNGMSTGF